ncbi:MAG: carboxypeptidase-like regulatory domain-containing protein [Terriglobales bacterium]
MLLRNTLRNLSLIPGLIVVSVFVTLAPSLLAQIPGTGALAGKVTDASGGVVANATVTATRVDNGQVRRAITSSDGTYKFDGLPPVTYRVTFEADGLRTSDVLATVKENETAVLDGKLEAGEQVNGSPAPSQQSTLPNAPSSNTTAPSLEDLGLTPQQTQGSAQDQARLDKRTHMLKIHQRLGLITLAPLIATFITSANAGGKNTSTADRTTHMVLGAVSGDLYFMTAYYAIRAPRIPGTETRGPIRLHKAMAWIHGPGMILTPILGAIAYNQKNSGEKVHGIASAHGPVAIVTGAAFGIAVMSVSLKF